MNDEVISTVFRSAEAFLMLRELRHTKLKLTRSCVRYIQFREAILGVLQTFVGCEQASVVAQSDLMRLK